MTARILIIAGSDSGGGAGIQADIKTVTMLGGHAMTAITAVTAQNTLGVDAIHAIPTDMVIAQIDAVVRDIGVDAVKIGMIGSAETAEAVADRLEVSKRKPVVFDPVMIATSGSVLTDDNTIASFRRLMRLATVVTPNLPELEVLSGLKIESRADMEKAANLLLDQHGCAVVAKGGHLLWASKDQVLDILVTREGCHSWPNKRRNTLHTHGTGCTLASALATGLAQDKSLYTALDRAIDFVQHALLFAPELGMGSGPIGHMMGRTPYYNILEALDEEGYDVKSFAARWKNET